ncbi:MAG: TIGR03905 family TSCPD domain-containing protein [Coriobacteriia bacterium]|nr:TIGR03905 family TSCPD domain-containing protein [Coriobacteriia bacterium]
MYTYQTQRTCSRSIDFDVVDGKVRDVDFVGGCDGNTKGIAKLVEGRPVEEVIECLEGIDCRGRGTSCPDQLARALKLVLDQQS